VLQVSFLLAEQDRKGFGSSAHLGIFMYLKTALGLRKHRALYLWFLLYLLYQLALVAKASGDHLQNRQEAIQKNDLLDIHFDRVSFLSYRAIVHSCTSMKRRQRHATSLAI
jgi:hypothetical protein